MQYWGVEARLPAWKVSPSIPQLVNGVEGNTAGACGQQSRLPVSPLLLPAFSDGSASGSTQHSSPHSLFLPGLCLWYRLHPSRKPCRTPHTQGQGSSLPMAQHRSSFWEHQHCHQERQPNQVSVSLSQLSFRFAKISQNTQNSLNPTKIIKKVKEVMIKYGEAYIHGFPSSNLLFSLNLLLSSLFFGFFLLHHSVVGVRVGFLQFHHLLLAFKSIFLPLLLLHLLFVILIGF